MKFIEPDMPGNWYWFQFRCCHQQLCSIGHPLTQREYRRLAKEHRRELCSKCYEREAEKITRDV